jgi:hypothetical protein
MPGKAVAAWGALSSLTSLEVDVLSSLAPAVKQLPNLLELSFTGTAYFRDSPLMMVSAMTQLQILRLPATDRFCSHLATKQQLDGLSTLQQLRHVDGMCLDSADLNHPFVTRCYPSIQIIISTTDGAGNVEEWFQTGEGRQVTKLLIYYAEGKGLSNPSSSHGGSITKPIISQWSGFTALKSLELIHLDLSPGLQQLTGLTQLTHLKLEGCSPHLHSFDQLPPGLYSLSLDNLRWKAALHVQQQQQQVSSTSTPQLPHLTSLTLSGDIAVSCAGMVVSALSKLQHLVLDSTFAFISTLSPLSRLTSLSSLIISHIGQRDRTLKGTSVLRELSSLQQLEVTAQSFNPIYGLEIAASLRHLAAITLQLRICEHFSMVSGGMLQVKCWGMK